VEETKGPDAGMTTTSMNPIQEEEDDGEDTIQRYKTGMMSMNAGKRQTQVKFEDDEDEFNQRGSGLPMPRNKGYSNPWDLEVSGRQKKEPVY
jgi:glycerol-3-phosphate cytidylyltransferase-like family protein